MLNSFDLRNFYKHKLFKNTLVYTSSNILNRAIPVFLLPILTYYLSPYDYGIIATFEILVAIAFIFVSLNTPGAVGVSFFKMDKSNLKIYIGNAITLVSISFLAISGIIFLIKTPLSLMLKFPANWLPIIGIVALLNFGCTLTLTLWQSEQRPLPYGFFQISQTFLNLGLSLYFIVILNGQWQGRLWGTIISLIIFAIVGIFVIFKRGYIKFSFKKNYVKDILLFGIPLIPHALAGWIMTATDRIFISTMVGVEATGLYVVGYQVGNIMELLASSFNLTWAPFLFQKLKEDNFNTKRMIVKFTYFYFAAVLMLAFTISLLAPLFFKIFIRDNFYSAHKYVLWIALGGAANGMYYMVVNYIFYLKKNYLLAGVTFGSAILNIFFNYFLIKAHGAIGAAQATTISSFITFFIVWGISIKLYDMPWNILRGGKK